MAREVNVSVRWRDGLVLAGGPAGRPAVVMDGNSKEAASPVELLLAAAAACTGTDIVGILEKSRVQLRTLEIAARGTRREEHPRRFTAIHFDITVSGEGADESNVRRAIDLSIEKYCSVLASLAPDIAVDYTVRIA